MMSNSAAHVSEIRASLSAFTLTERCFSVRNTKHTLSVFVIDTKHTSDCHLATVLLLGYDMPLLVSSGSE